MTSNSPIWNVALYVCLLLGLLFPAKAQPNFERGPAEPAQYLTLLKDELRKPWPQNRTINIVFHGHSVPAGYFDTPTVNTLAAYPHQLLHQLKVRYPNAVINVITTAIGGENSVLGAQRFDGDVLTHKPDVVCIDYALNDAGIGLQKAEQAWVQMIEQALRQGIKVILLTPTPDQRVDRTQLDNALQQHAEQVRKLATRYNVGLVDSDALFTAAVHSGIPLPSLMSHVNHPNQAGHALIAKALMNWFE